MNLRTYKIVTLDETHKQHMENFKKQKKLLPTYKQTLADLTAELAAFDTEKTYTPESIKKKATTKEQIKDLQKKIYNIEHDTSEMEYYYKIDDTVMDYYNISNLNDGMLYANNPELHEEKIKQPDEEQTENKLKMLNNMKKGKSHSGTKKTVKKRKKKNEPAKSANVLSYFTVENKQQPQNTLNNKAELLDIYMSLIDNEYQDSKRSKRSIVRKCNKCDVEKILSTTDGALICQNCGETEMIIIDNEKPNYKDAITDSKPGYPYKKINHFNEWLAQFMARESSEISKEIYDQILTELYKQKMTDLTQLTIPLIEQILKKLKLTQYYEHTTHIISKLSGIPPPSINRKTEEKMRHMFKEIQAPFEKHRPPDRVNFLSYSYVLHKFCQLLELDEFIKYFPLLKSRDKLRIQDSIWKKICAELRWQYIPSV